MQVKGAKMDVAFHQVNAQLIEVRYSLTHKFFNSTPIFIILIVVKMISVHFSKLLRLLKTFVFLSTP